MGAASAGVPLSLAVHQYGWGVFFSALIASCAAIFVLLAPFWNQKARMDDIGSDFCTDNEYFGSWYELHTVLWCHHLLMQSRK